MKQKIKVCWICQVSNARIRQHLSLGSPWWIKMIRRIMGLKTDAIVADYGIWNTNAIEEFEKFDDVEVHVIFTHWRMRKNIQEFQEGNIHYYAVNSGDTSLWRNIKMYLKLGSIKYEKTWRTISKQVEKINPDIIHIMGAENPYYSLSILSLPKSIPVIVQLQVLLHNPVAEQHHKPNKAQKDCEFKVLQHADYIGSRLELNAKYIRQLIRPDAVIVNTRLLVAEKVDRKRYEKQYDFVYFANNVSKALDLAIEGFAVAFKQNNTLTLDLIGGLSDNQRLELDSKLSQLGIKNAVTIEGRLPTHNDVIIAIKKARFALLPLKTDFISSTIREAMYAGIPVITTETEGTPLLNENRESVLLSQIGDANALALNMIRLVNDSELAETLRSNAYLTVEEKYGNNTERAREWVEAYNACIDNFKNGTPIPDRLINNG